MASERMRRVDEAIRQVLADALAGELADPRVGFVTVTDVKTSPDLRTARVFVSVLGDEAVRERTLAGLHSAHGLLQRRIAARAAPAPHADAASSTTTRRPTARCASTRCCGSAMSQATTPLALDTREQVLRRSAAASASCSSATSTPTATRSARWSRCRRRCGRSARTP